jgi:predicted nucleic acid-binding protein
MYKKIFFDANILLDLFDVNRVSHSYSKKAYEHAIKNCELFTSCDIITTLYYIGHKIDKNHILQNIQAVNKTLKIIEFSNQEVEQTCNLMLQNLQYKDLEDTMQYILAKKYECDLIVSNDVDFYSQDIKVLSSKEFCKVCKL